MKTFLIILFLTSISFGQEVINHIRGSRVYTITFYVLISNEGDTLLSSEGDTLITRKISYENNNSFFNADSDGIRTDLQRRSNKCERIYGIRKRISTA